MVGVWADSTGSNVVSNLVGVSSGCVGVCGICNEGSTGVSVALQATSISAARIRRNKFFMSEYELLHPVG